MAYEERKPFMAQIETLRQGRRLICFLNFDKPSTQSIPALNPSFDSRSKEALFRVLKESVQRGQGIDLFFYTCGGSINCVWPIASLIREFDPEFQILVPYRCLSAGTLLALGSRNIVMTPLSELSPIDPSCGNEFNPQSKTNPQQLLPIGVEDVQAYRDFIERQFNPDGVKATDDAWRQYFHPSLQRLVQELHPLAIGNVYRTHQLIIQLDESLLSLNPSASREIKDIVKQLTTGFYSHYRSINRHEAKEILGEDKVEFASDDLATAMDDLLREYESGFELRKLFSLAGFLGDHFQKSARFIGGSIESADISYLFETKGIIKQYSFVPPNIQTQIPFGQSMNLIPGLPRQQEFVVTSEAWIHNDKGPQGVTL